MSSLQKYICTWEPYGLYSFGSHHLKVIENTFFSRHDLNLKHCQEKEDRSFSIGKHVVNYGLELLLSCEIVINSSHVQFPQTNECVANDMFCSFCCWIAQNKTYICNFCRYIEDSDKKILLFQDCSQAHGFIVRNLMQFLHLKLLAFVNHCLIKM